MDFLSRAHAVAVSRASNLAERPPMARGFREALRGEVEKGNVGLVLEFKRCSPRGFVSYLTPREFLERVRGVADAISVLVEPYWFCGSLELLPFFSPEAPVLAKDFVVKEVQLDAHMRWGASATLLILDLVGWRKLGELYEYSRSRGVDVLVEVARSDEALDVMHSFPEALVGINTRNLRTLELNPGRAVREVRKTAESKPTGTILIAESGVESMERVQELVEAGADALLIGTWVMKDPLATQKLRLLKERRLGDGEVFQQASQG